MQIIMKITKFFNHHWLPDPKFAKYIKDHTRGSYTLVHLKQSLHGWNPKRKIMFNQNFNL